MKEVERAAEGVFAVITKSEGLWRQDPDFTPPQDYVDALGELIDGDLLISPVNIGSPEEVWGVEATRVAQSRIAQARRFREWGLK